MWSKSSSVNRTAIRSTFWFARVTNACLTTRLFSETNLITLSTVPQRVITADGKAVGSFLSSDSAVGTFVKAVFSPFRVAEDPTAFAEAGQ